MLSSKFDKFLLNNQNIQFKSEDITVYCNSFILKKMFKLVTLVATAAAAAGPGINVSISK